MVWAHRSTTCELDLVHGSYEFMSQKEKKEPNQTGLGITPLQSNRCLKIERNLEIVTETI